MATLLAAVALSFAPVAGASTETIPNAVPAAPESESAPVGEPVPTDEEAPAEVAPVQAEQPDPIETQEAPLPSTGATATSIERVVSVERAVPDATARVESEARSIAESTATAFAAVKDKAAAGDVEEILAKGTADRLLSQAPALAEGLRSSLDGPSIPGLTDAPGVITDRSGVFSLLRAPSPQVASAPWSDHPVGVVGETPLQPGGPFELQRTLAPIEPLIAHPLAHPSGVDPVRLGTANHPVSKGSQPLPSGGADYLRPNPDTHRSGDPSRPNDLPPPMPRGPVAVPSASGGPIFVPIAALLALLALAAPATHSRRKKAPGSRVSSLFVCALERPG